jgi:molybdopterin-synthase adenylyltransferase
LLNDLCLQHRIPLLVYKQKTFEIELGPLVIPHETACYLCYELRIAGALSPYEESIISDIMNKEERLNFPLAIDSLALEIIKFVSYIIEPITRGRLWRLNFLTGSSTIHTILKLPRCPSCGVNNGVPTRKLWEEIQ